jgi:hypothetical protein
MIATIQYAGASCAQYPAAALDGPGLAAALDALEVRSPVVVVVRAPRAIFDGSPDWSPAPPPGYVLHRMIGGLSAVWLVFEASDRRETIAP